MNTFIKRAGKICLGGALFVGGVEFGGVFAKGYVLGIMQKTGFDANQMLEKLEDMDKTAMQKIRAYIIKDVAQWSSKRES